MNKDQITTLAEAVDVPDSFYAKFGARAPVNVEDDDIDAELILELTESLKVGGWDNSKPIVLAQGPKEVQGMVIDGNHRFRVLWILHKEGIEVTPTIVFERIKDIHHYKMRVCHYIRRSRSKSSVVANRLIHKNVTEVIEANYTAYGDGLPDYIVNKLDFHAPDLVGRLYRQIKREKTGEKKSSSHRSHKQEEFTDSLATTDWGLVKNIEDESQSVGDRKMGSPRYVEAIRKKCPHCNNEIIVTRKEDGTTDVKKVSDFQ